MSTKLEQWEKRLTALLNDIDIQLEEHFKDVLAIRPNRPAAGTTSNPKYDGLVGLSFSFSMGYSSGIGPNYTVSLRLASMHAPSCETWEDMLAFTYERLCEQLPVYFSSQQLSVLRNGEFFHIIGDLDFNK